MSPNHDTVKFAVPKGSLQKATADFLRSAGLSLEGYGADSRGYRPTTDLKGVVVKVLRPQEIPMLISRGHYDLGISGQDWYTESQCQRNVVNRVDLGFGRVDIVLAVPNCWEDVNKPSDLFRKFRGATRNNPLRIWTEYLNIADEFVLEQMNTEATIVSPYMGMQRERHAAVEIYHSFGATESKPPEDGQAIIDNTETGRTLRANGLKIIHRILPSSTARLLINEQALSNDAKVGWIERIVRACEKVAPRKKEVNGHLNW